MASLSSLFFKVKSAPSFSNNTAVSPRQCVSSNTNTEDRSHVLQIECYEGNLPCPSAMAWCSGVKPSLSVALRGLLLRSRRLTSGSDPTAAARWMEYCPRRSRTRVEALFSIKMRATSRFFLEATKWRAVCSSLTLVSLISHKHEDDDCSHFH